MRLLDLMKLASDAYGDGTMEAYFDDKTGAPIKMDHVDKKGRYWMMLPDGGDTLAAFIVLETHSLVHDPDDVVDLILPEDLREVRRGLRMAIDDLERVHEAVDQALSEMEADDDDDV